MSTLARRRTTSGWKRGGGRQSSPSALRTLQTSSRSAASFGGVSGSLPNRSGRVVDSNGDAAIDEIFWSNSRDGFLFR